MGGEPPRRPDVAKPQFGVAFHAAAIFASAFLIFLVQPMVGKRILPWFGGVPSVWTLCLAFYQTALFLGYLYAHLMIRFVAPRLQLAIHSLVVVAAIASLPVLPESSSIPLRNLDPTFAVLRILTTSVAIPFLLLASTGPLVQAWFARSHPTRSPYPLYAVSNVGSFLALFVYPFVLEPSLSLSETSRLWTFGFAATGLAVLACGFSMTRSSDSAGAAERERIAFEGPSPEFVRPLLWMGLSSTAVVLLMGVTNKLCLDVASIPFLWIVPLAIYLMTFILCFSSERVYRRWPWVTAAVGSFAATLVIGPRGLIAYQILGYGALLFGACMVLHGELFRSRPAPRLLTRFYLFVSAGGALGGLLVGIAAPRFFDGYYELHAGLLLSVVALLAVCVRDPASSLSWAGQHGRWLFIAPVVLAAVGLVAWYETRPEPMEVHRERSFFGVLTVHEIAGSSRTLTNGTTVHGTQLLNGTSKRLPTSYFGRATGLGLALTSRAQDGGSRIGVVGLGVGTLAAYGRAGDLMRFYEIDPVVMKLSSPGGYFSFVEDSKARIELILGDARLSLEDEQRRKHAPAFDILVLDAFSSDAIPIHLMTREAFSLYFETLAPDGLMIVHVSNRHFQLMGLVARLAAEFGAHSLQITTRPVPRLQSALAEWVVISRDPDELTRLRIRIEKRHRGLGLNRNSILMRLGAQTDLDAFPLWTDDYSDLWRVMRWH